MTKLALRHWVLLTTLIPTVVISLGLASYFSYIRHQELSEALAQQAETIAASIAIASEPALLSNNKQDIKRLLDGNHRKNPAIVKSIAVFNAHHELLVTTNYHKDFQLLQLSEFRSAPNIPQQKLTEDSLVLHYPISAESAGALPEAIGYVAVQLARDKSRLHQQNALLGTTFLIALILVLSLYTNLRLIRRVIQPIRAMSSVIRKLSQGEYQQHLPTPYLGELESLRTNLNKLAASLQQYEADAEQSIEQATEDLQFSLDQLERQNIELDLARKRALEDNRSKSDFLAKVSHELRTPLNAVIGFTRQLLKTQLTSNQQDYLTTIQRSSNTLLILVNDVLDYAKLEKGRMPINPEPFSLRELLNDSTELLATNAFDKQLELVLFIENDCPDNLIADPIRLNQIITNLAGNAIKFTEQGHVILHVSAKTESEGHYQLHFTVHDTGIGIDIEQQKSLFESFNQGEQHLAKRYDGTGLGLLISQRLVQAMGGKLGFQSQQGQGSIFWFTLPCKTHELPIAEALPVNTFLHKSVLYFEAQQKSREAMLAQLENWGLQVTTCSHFDQLSTTLALRPHFDFVIFGSSLSLNEVNQLIATVQQLRQHSDHLFLLVSSLSPNLRELLLASGATAVLTKPAHYRKLAMALAQPYQAQPEPNKPLMRTKAKLRVLCVDDNPANLKLINTLLNEMVEQVDSASNGLEAWQKASQAHYDLIFMDINMPVMDGVQACQRIQHQSLNETTPIIAVTAHALPDEKERLLDLGFSEFLTKPLDETLLQYALRECCPYFVNTLPTVSAEAQLPVSKQLDWGLALQRADGKLELAKEMLDLLINSLPHAQQAISEAIEQQDENALLQQVHKLHGATCYTGLPMLKQLTEEIEIQLKKGCSIAHIEPELYELQDRIGALINDAKRWSAINT